MKGVCTDRDCLFPGVCAAIKPDHEEYLDILRSMRKLDKVKKVFIRSGIRYDYLMADPKCDAFIEELCRYHVSGTLKVAPEHVSKNVLGYMHKAPKKVFLEFAAKYKETNKRLGMKQYLIPYLISSHPGSTLKDAVELGAVPEGIRFCSRSGSGFLSNSRHAGYLHVLYRDGPSDYGAGICGQNYGRKENAESPHTFP